MYAAFAAILFVGYDFYSVYKESLAAGRPKELAAFEAGKHTYSKVSSWLSSAKELHEEVTEVKAEEPAVEGQINR
jgi:hypothetical protein